MICPCSPSPRGLTCFVLIFTSRHSRVPPSCSPHDVRDPLPLSAPAVTHNLVARLHVHRDAHRKPALGEGLLLPTSFWRRSPSSRRPGAGTVDTRCAGEGRAATVGVSTRRVRAVKVPRDVSRHHRVRVRRHAFYRASLTLTRARIDVARVSTRVAVAPPIAAAKPRASPTRPSRASPRARRIAPSLETTERTF